MSLKLQFPSNRAPCVTPRLTNHRPSSLRATAVGGACEHKNGCDRRANALIRAFKCNFAGSRFILFPSR